MEGVDAAYYLIHWMGASGAFDELDRIAASNFANAAGAAGVRRIIYLGGLGERHGLSAHLASRHEVGGILRSSGIPTIEFRASIVIGSGSASYEIVRALIKTLPVMVTPRRVETRAQPIAIDDLLEYPLAALDMDPAESTIFEIRGADLGPTPRSSASTRGSEGCEGGCFGLACSLPRRRGSSLG